MLQKLDEFVQGASRVLVAFSGGLDSTVLLHLLRHSTWGHRVSAVHVNHGLQGQADAWEAHCRALCGEWGIPFTSFSLSLPTDEGNIEARARDARYRVIADMMAPGDVVVTGHHASDQAETLLYRLTRGAGLAGMAGMHECREFASGWLYRPLLTQSRAQLLAYAQAHSLTWVDDPSNDVLHFDRNYLRAEVLAPLRQRWPHFDQAAQRSAAQLAEASALLQRYVAADVQRCAPSVERLGFSLDLTVLREFDESRRAAVLRAWLMTFLTRPPSFQSRAALEALCLAREDAAPELIIGEGRCCRFRDRVYFLPQWPLPKPTTRVWHRRETIVLGDGAVLIPPLEDGAPWPGGPLEIRFRAGGERVQPRERTHSQTLKKVLHEYALEPWLRDRVPLVYRGDALLAVAGVFVTSENGAEALQGCQWLYNTAAPGDPLVVSE